MPIVKKEMLIKIEYIAESEKLLINLINLKHNNFWIY